MIVADLIGLPDGTLFMSPELGDDAWMKVRAMMYEDTHITIVSLKGKAHHLNTEDTESTDDTGRILRGRITVLRDTRLALVRIVGEG